MDHATKLRALRRKKKWSLVDAAKILSAISGQKISSARFVNWELGRTDVPVPKLIIKALEAIQ